MITANDKCLHICIYIYIYRRVWRASPNNEMVKLRTFAGNPNNVVSPIYARRYYMENCLYIFPAAGAAVSADIKCVRFSSVCIVVCSKTIQNANTCNWFWPIAHRCIIDRLLRILYDIFTQNKLLRPRAWYEIIIIIICIARLCD